MFWPFCQCYFRPSFSFSIYMSMLYAPGTTGLCCDPCGGFTNLVCFLFFSQIVFYVPVIRVWMDGPSPWGFSVPVGCPVTFTGVLPWIPLLPNTAVTFHRCAWFWMDPLMPGTRTVGYYYYYPDCNPTSKSKLL